MVKVLSIFDFKMKNILRMRYCLMNHNLDYYTYFSNSKNINVRKNLSVDIQYEFF